MMPVFPTKDRSILEKRHDEKLDQRLRLALHPVDSPIHFSLGVMARINADQAPSRSSARPDWMRWGSALLAAGTLMLVLGFVSPTPARQQQGPPQQHTVTVQSVKQGMENLFYNLTDALARPTMRLSEYLLGGIQIAP